MTLSHCAGLQPLTALQQLEVLRVPCDDAQATARLAAQLPRLRSLDLRCCPMRCCAPGETHDEATVPLQLMAATALTELRLHMCGGAAKTVKCLQMPPQLQVNAQGSLLSLCSVGSSLQVISYKMCRPISLLNQCALSEAETLLACRRWM